MGKSSFKLVPLQTARKRVLPSSSRRPIPASRAGVQSVTCKAAMMHCNGDFDDGWTLTEGPDQADQHQQEIHPPPLRTIVTPETARSILSRNTSP
jgi:hypothetical protein